MHSTTSAVETKPPERFRHTLRPVPRSLTYDSAWAEFYQCGPLELAEAIESLRYRVADPIDPVDAHMSGERLRAARDVQSRQERAYAAGRDVPDPHGSGFQPWRDLTARLRSMPLIRAVYEETGFTVALEGRTELHGPCVACGGEDRFVIFLTPGHERFYCRRCDWSGDVFALARTVLRASFPEALAHLAARAGLALPAARSDSARSQTASRFLPVRTGGGRRGG